MSTTESGNADFSEHILIVEDDSITARYLELGLKRIGYANLRTANSSEAAWEAVQLAVPDLVLMDIQIDGSRDGIDTARLLHQRFNVPVIFLTGLADAATMERARDAEPMGYLLKPIKAEDLQNALLAAFQKERLAREISNRESWFSATLEVIDEPLFGCDSKGLLIYANAAARKFFAVAAAATSTFRELVPLFDALGENAIDPEQLSEGTTNGLLKRATGNLPVELKLKRVIDERQRWLGTLLTMRLASDENALAAEIRRLRAELSAQSLTDELTGLYSRRGLDVLGDRHIKVLRRSHATISLVVIALEGVKELNDLFGRQAGDQALKDYANLLRTTCRESDLVCRLGGSEFGVLVNSPQPDDLILRLRANAERYAASAVVPFKMQFTAACAPLNPKGTDRIPQLLAAADVILRKQREMI